MTCERLKLPDGTAAIVCSRDRKAKAMQCEFCGLWTATLLCDGPTNWRTHPRRKKTCDAALCASCAQEVGEDRHLCPRCQKNQAPQQLGLL